MAWSEAYRLVGFLTLTGGATPTRALDLSIDGSQERSRVLGLILWLELGVRIGYFTRTDAQRAIVGVSPVFEDIYDWLRINGSAVPAGLVDDALRINSEGFTDQPLSGWPPAEVAGLHFRHALAVLGSYLSAGQGFWSPLAGAIMFASDTEWQSTLDVIGADVTSDPETPRPFIDDAAGVLRCMGAALTVGNGIAQDERLNDRQRQQLSIELLTRLSWPLYLGARTQLQRFAAFYSALTDRVVADLEALSLAEAMRNDVARLQNAWEGISQLGPGVVVPP